MATKQNMFSDVSGELAFLPPRVWLAALAFAIVSSIAEWLGWWSGHGLSAIDYAGLAVTLPAWLAMAYVSSMSLVSRQQSMSSFLRFAATTVILAAPIILGLTCWLILPSPHKDALLGAGLALIAVGWLAMTFLPALPLAQGLSNSPVSPLTMFKATKGHRWSLVLLSVLTASIDNVVPSTSTARLGAEAALLAVGNGFATAATTLVGACIGVTAWRYASRADGTLYGQVPVSDGL